MLHVSRCPARLAFILGVAVALSAVSSSLAQQPTLDDVLSRTATSVGQLIPRLANVVMAEAYDQRTYTQAFAGTTAIRQTVEWRLQSTVLLVRYPMGDLDWMMFRDVAEVNGTPLGHAPDRLLTLFAQPGVDADQRAAQISFESARHHIPGGSFAVTNPLLVVSLVQRHYQPRLRFTLGGEERSLGPGIRVLRFEERDELPSGADGKGPRERLPPLLTGLGRLRGNVWVEASSGRIVKTEARLGANEDTATTITTFGHDERLGLMVPREMRTTWMYRTDRTRRPVTGVATYSDFRRFEVRTEESLAGTPEP
jgi:hypothetical protein